MLKTSKIDQTQVKQIKKQVNLAQKKETGQHKKNVPKTSKMSPKQVNWAQNKENE